MRLVAQIFILILLASSPWANAQNSGSCKKSLDELKNPSVLQQAINEQISNFNNLPTRDEKMYDYFPCAMQLLSLTISNIEDINKRLDMALPLALATVRHDREQLSAADVLAEDFVKHRNAYTKRLLPKNPTQDQTQFLRALTEYSEFEPDEN